MELYVQDYESQENVNMFQEMGRMQISKSSYKITHMYENEVVELIKKENMEFPVLFWVEGGKTLNFRGVGLFPSAINKALKRINRGKILRDLEDFNVHENCMDGAIKEYRYLTENFPNFLYCSSFEWSNKSSYFTMFVECAQCGKQYSYRSRYKSPVCRDCEEQLKEYKFDEKIDNLSIEDYLYNKSIRQTPGGNMAQNKKPKWVKAPREFYKNYKRYLIGEYYYGINESTVSKEYIFLSPDYTLIKRGNGSFSVIKIYKKNLSN